MITKFLPSNNHRMISEGLCDTEDYSNDAVIKGINSILKYIKIENTLKKIWLV